MRHKSITLLLVLILMASGIVSLIHIPKDEFPSFTMPLGLVVGVYPGASALEVERQLARPLEEFLWTFKEIKKSKTAVQCFNDGCVAIVWLEPGVKQPTEFWNKLKERLNLFKLTLPSGVLAVIANDDFGDASAMLVTLESEQKTYREMDEYVTGLSDRLRSVSSLSNIIRMGGQKEQLAVYLDRDRLTKYGINTAMLMSKISGQTGTLYTGHLADGKLSRAIHVQSSLNTENDVAQTILNSSPSGEVVRVGDIATIQLETDAGGHFVFDIPAYYGQAILFMRASKSSLSEEKRRKKLGKGMLDETAWPDYYVKRDLFFPVFAKKYDYYQCHVPELAQGTDFDDYTLLDTARLSKMDQTLREVKVKGKRHRGRHAIDYSKPAYVYDAVDLYNLVTDRGLSFGRFESQRFPMQIAYALLGNYNSERVMQVAARLNDRELTPYVFYRNFDPGPTVMEQFRSDMWIHDRIKLNRQDEIRLFTDFELRNEDRPVPMQSTVADVTLDYMLLPDDAKRYTYRDRRIILDGMYEPADFYHPDYSHRPLDADMKDYRRTLYWNPNAQLDADGRFTATFYNNGKPTRIKVSTAGIGK